MYVCMHACIYPSSIYLSVYLSISTSTSISISVYIDIDRERKIDRYRKRENHLQPPREQRLHALRHRVLWPAFDRHVAGDELPRDNHAEQPPAGPVVVRNVDRDAKCVDRAHELFDTGAHECGGRFGPAPVRKEGCALTLAVQRHLAATRLARLLHTLHRAPTRTHHLAHLGGARGRHSDVTRSDGERQ